MAHLSLTNTEAAIRPQTQRVMEPPTRRSVVHKPCAV